jgi:hypothetical protein
MGILQDFSIWPLHEPQLRQDKLGGEPQRRRAREWGKRLSRLPLRLYQPSLNILYSRRHWSTVLAPLFKVLRRRGAPGQSRQLLQIPAQNHFRGNDSLHKNHIIWIQIKTAFGVYCSCWHIPAGTVRRGK